MSTETGAFYGFEAVINCKQEHFLRVLISVLISNDQLPKTDDRPETMEVDGTYPGSEAQKSFYFQFYQKFLKVQVESLGNKNATRDSVLKQFGIDNETFSKKAKELGISISK